jgi:hypothetical protein
VTLSRHRGGGARRLPPRRGGSSASRTMRRRTRSWRRWWKAHRRALCGKLWVPSRDPKRFPCAGVQGDLRVDLGVALRPGLPGSGRAAAAGPRWA